MSISRTLVLLPLLSSVASAQVLRVAELTGEELRALDRQRTVVILPGGILEQHGPHLPSYSDGYQNEYVAAALARAIARRPGWKALVFPPIPLGAAGANVIGGHFTWPGTYTVRSTTLRSIFMDLATELGDQGFRWVFIVHGHGAPHHNRALDDAGDFFRDTYGGRMVHLRGMSPDSSRFDAVYARVPQAAREEDANSTHAGLVETSIVWHLRPDLVEPNVRTLATVAAASADQRKAVAESPTWPGYFGAPRLATRDIGRALLEAETEDCVRLALRILDGFDERTLPRYADGAFAIPSIREIVDRAIGQERAIEKREQEWLSKAGRGDSLEAIAAPRGQWNDAIARRDSVAFRSLSSRLHPRGDGSVSRQRQPND